MICTRCLRRLAAGRRTIPSRTFTTTPSTRAEAVTTSNTQTSNPRPAGHPAATSTSAAQPFSTPLSPSPKEHEDDAQAPSYGEAEIRKRERTPSSVPAGTVLKGLNFMKNAQDATAMEDDQYPDWLWDVLREKQAKAGEGEVEGEGDLFSKSKKQRRKAAKALRRQQMMGQDSEVQIPMYEQSVDLPGEGTKAREAREELTGTMRKERRRKIKEDNFLRAMG